jgi:hypothetical protein
VELRNHIDVGVWHTLLDSLFGVVISVSWFGPPSEVNFGPLGISFIGFVDGATEAELADQERQGGVV